MGGGIRLTCSGEEGKLGGKLKGSGKVGNKIRRGGEMLILNYLKGKGVNLLALVRAIGRGKPACSDEEGKG